MGSISKTCLCFYQTRSLRLGGEQLKKDKEVVLRAKLQYFMIFDVVYIITLFSNFTYILNTPAQFLCERMNVDEVKVQLKGAPAQILPQAPNWSGPPLY